MFGKAWIKWWKITQPKVRLLLTNFFQLKLIQDGPIFDLSFPLPSSKDTHKDSGLYPTKQLVTHMAKQVYQLFSFFQKKKKKNQSFFYHFASAKIFSTDNEMLLRICMGTSRQGSTRSVLGFEKHKGRPQSFFFLYLFHHCTTILNRKSKPTYHTDHFHMLINNLSLQYQIVYSGRDKLIKLEKSEWGKRVKHESKSNQVRTSWF